MWCRIDGKINWPKTNGFSHLVDFRSAVKRGCVSDYDFNENQRSHEQEAKWIMQLNDKIQQNGIHNRINYIQILIDLNNGEENKTFGTNVFHYSIIYLFQIQPQF